MRMYGKLVEFKASLFYTICPYQISVAKKSDTPVKMPDNIEDLKVYDEDMYTYDPNFDTYVTLKKSGWYEFRAKMNFEQTQGNSRSNVYGWFAQNVGQGWEALETTRSYAYMRNTSARYGTVVITQPVKIEHDNAQIRLYAARDNVNSTILIRANEATLFLRRLRPLQDTEEN